jgi:putative heme-binding domain-containing protein
MLAHPDGWVRETAQRLLTERRAGLPAIPLLGEIALKPPTPQSRVHALWTLRNLGVLDCATLLPAFEDATPGVRETACRLAEELLGEPAVAASVTRLADDPEPMVRFQAALSLGLIRSPEAVVALGRIARQDSRDPWTRTAVLTAINNRELEFLTELEREPALSRSDSGRLWLEGISDLIGASRRPELRAAILDRFLAADSDPALSRSVLVGLGRGLQRVGGGLHDLLHGPYADRIDALTRRAAAIVEDPTLALEARIEAIRLLPLGPGARSIAALPGRLDARESPELQIEALRALGSITHPDVSLLVIERWKAMSPSVRREAAEVLLSRTDRANQLLDAIQNGVIPRGELDPTRRKQLAEHPEARIRRRAAEVLGANPVGDRANALARYLPALATPGDPERGRLIFRKACATCHRIGSEGSEVGPNLATVAAKPPEELAIHVLDPNREIAPAYVNYNVATTDGGIVSGIVVEETAGVVTLRRAEGVTESIPRDRIERIQATGQSLMPEGLESAISPVELADVLAFIRGLEPRTPPR